MTKLEVKCATKDFDGVVQTIGGPLWGKHTRQAAVQNILNGTHSYYVSQPNGSFVDIHVYKDRFLRTDPDKHASNNLDNLGFCPIF